MNPRYRSFFLAAILAFAIEIVVIFVFQILYRGLDCGLLEQRICSLPVFFSGITQLVASINIYTLGLPTILLALLIGGAWRMYKELRQSGVRRRDLITPQL